MKGTMADYYTNFSLVLPFKKEQTEYALELVKQIEAHRNEDQPLPPTFPSELKEVVEDWCFEVEPEKEGLWLHSQDGGQEVACLFIQHLLQHFDSDGWVAFEWSHDCSKPRTDAYGGGAAFITATKIETFTTSDWLRTKSP